MELKFRAWHKGNLENGEFIPFHTVKSPGVVRFEWISDLSKHPLNYDVGNILADDDWIVEQYTGLKDMNGKEIYEGDILQHNVGEYSFIGARCKGVYQYYIQGENDNYDLIDICDNNNCDLEIIGNIHEDSELLND